MNKSLFKSKTFWVNLLLAIAPLFPVLQPILNEEVMLQLFGIVNILLRVVTKEPVSVPLLKK